LNWPQSFERRLTSWAQLRESVLDKSPAEALLNINQWWFSSPWTPYYLHWDDRETWPDPWQLVNENIFCDVARGLGILYTITMIDRQDLSDFVLIDVGSHNLVLDHQEKYILNYQADSIVNNNFKEYKVRNRITQQEMRSKLT
jgi:hypothetical protein